uniref:Uncharacterized protein n=1 Tax=Plectus sambesii TaxID=2011161 RepID=A0A914WXL8_9BILA
MEESTTLTESLTEHSFPITDASPTSLEFRDARIRGPKRKWVGWDFFEYARDDDAHKVDYQEFQASVRRKAEEEVVLYSSLTRLETDHSENRPTPNLPIELVKKIDDLIALFFALPNISLNAVDSSEFKGLMSAACPGYPIKSRKTVTS